MMKFLKTFRQSILWKKARPNGGIKGSPNASVEHHGYFSHESAIIDDDVEIGRGTKIWHFSHIMNGSKIGEGCNIGHNVVIGPDVTIGNGCRIQNNVHVFKGVILEDKVFCGPSMVFTNVITPRAGFAKMDQALPTIVEKGVSLGANCTVLCGNTIGRYAFIGAGAVVTKDVPDHALMVGNPARQTGWCCICGEKLLAELRCGSCGKVYELRPEGSRPRIIGV